MILAQKRIVCAANKLGETVVCSARHFDRRMHAAIDELKALGDERSWAQSEQGFIDQFGEFHDRKAALVIADAAGQLNVFRPKTSPKDELFSEDLY